MPPAISDEEASEYGEATAPKSSTRGKKAASSSRDAEGTLDVVIRSGIVNGDAGGGDQAEEDDEEEGLGEDLGEDEFIVEKILGHMADPKDNSVKFKVKWEGWEKKSDQTWEDYDNLRENATDVLDEYLASVGGLDKILEDSKTALKTKKRGRPALGTPTNGAKRRRNDSHPGSETPPVSGRVWRTPTGSWENDVESIDACHDEATGKLIVYLTWKDGHKTQHDTKTVYSRCPQKMLQFYERHVKIVMQSSDGPTKDEA
ncbi:heterochromatin protein one [Hypoxylon rubiginosum]|uniref:Heterochromatin protein one n=1 Tax=Hypoxylon rubiginosum TaxID=110542 RepID=A0ACC0DGY5_9PEZI|nr:heterochromatin protein one [Hypoxylon rubiginosum]